VSKKSVSKDLQSVIEAKDIKGLERSLSPLKVNRLSASERQKIAQLFYENGKNILEKCVSADDFIAASSSLERALELDPEFDQGWALKAQALFKLSLLTAQEDDFLRSIEAYCHLDNLCKQKLKKLSLEVLWEWGLAYSHLARHSGEPGDFKKCIDKFNEAHALGLDAPEFLADFASALGELGLLSGNIHWLNEAVVKFEDSLAKKSLKGDDWVKLGCIYKLLYFSTQDFLYFEKADHSFFEASRLEPEWYRLWLNWGELLGMEGKAVRDSGLLLQALEKIEKAAALMPEELTVKLATVDILIHLGAFEEKLECLRESESILSELIISYPESIEAIFLLAHCFINYGKYFGESSYFHKAADILRKGVKLEPHKAALWNSLGMSYFFAGEIHRDPAELEKAVHFCGKAVEKEGKSPVLWNDWGVALLKLGEMTQDGKIVALAVEKFEMALKHFHQNFQGNPDPDWLYNYGCALDYLGDFEGHIPSYEKAVAVLSHLHEIYPEARHVKYNLGLALYHFGDATGDEEALKKALEYQEAVRLLEPEDEAILQDIGLTALALADVYQEAFQSAAFLEYASKAVQYLFAASQAGAEEAHYWLSNAYSLLENESEAFKQLEIALKKKALPPVEEIEENNWLEYLHDFPKFQEFLEELRRLPPK
jgi:tetratricopeptide (TPR) repeat protein